MKATESLAPHLPYLRRYARALTGSQASGDAFVRAALRALLAGQQELTNDIDPRVALYRVFHAIWSSSAETLDEEAPIELNANPEERLRALAAPSRAALLLTAVECFEFNEAAIILGETPEEVERASISALNAIEQQLASRVLIIEDESVIALDLKKLVSDLGHEVVGMAATSEEAVILARKHKPGLILADINLGAGGSGTDAVAEILKSVEVPVIFVTAYPERLLTGERPEPTYLVTKPFLPETVQAMVGQVLFFHSSNHKQPDVQGTRRK